MENERLIIIRRRHIPIEILQTIINHKRFIRRVHTPTNIPIPLPHSSSSLLHSSKIPTNSIFTSFTINKTHTITIHHHFRLRPIPRQRRGRRPRPILRTTPPHAHAHAHAHSHSPRGDDGVGLVVVDHVRRVVLDVPGLAGPAELLHGEDRVEDVGELGAGGGVLGPAGAHELRVGGGAPRRDLRAHRVLGDVVDDLERRHARVRVAPREALPQDDPKAVDVRAPRVAQVDEDLRRGPRRGAERDGGRQRRRRRRWRLQAVVEGQGVLPVAVVVVGAEVRSRVSQKAVRLG